MIGDEPTQLASDVTGAIDPSAPVVLTDGLRAVERNFGRVHDGASATLIPGDARRLGNPTRDYLLPDADRWSTTGRIDGANAVFASSSMSDADAFGTVQPGQLPTAAVDGDDETAWTSNYRTDESAWWQVDFDASRRRGHGYRHGWAEPAGGSTSPDGERDERVGRTGSWKEPQPSASGPGHGLATGGGRLGPRWEPVHVGRGECVRLDRSALPGAAGDCPRSGVTPLTSCCVPCRMRAPGARMSTAPFAVSPAATWRPKSRPVSAGASYSNRKVTSTPNSRCAPDQATRCPPGCCKHSRSACPDPLKATRTVAHRCSVPSMVIRGPPGPRHRQTSARCCG